MGSLNWVPFVSAQDLSGRLPAAIGSGVPTLLYNRVRWYAERHLARAVAQTDCLVADNDGTVVSGNQWSDMRGRMDPTHRAADQEDAASYFRGERSDAGDVAFLLRSVARLVSSGLRWAHLAEDAARQPPRAGTRELFRSYGQARAAIVSHGIHDYIRAWADAHAVPVSEVYAARLRWGADHAGDRLHGCDHQTVVVESNKRAAKDAFGKRVGCVGRDILVVEDTPSMLARMVGPGNVGVLLVPPSDSEPHRPASRLRQLAHDDFLLSADLVLVSDSLEPLCELRG